MPSLLEEFGAQHPGRGHAVAHDLVREACLVGSIFS